MVIKPNLGERIFWGAAGFSLLLTACAGIAAPMPGLLLACLGAPLAVFSFGFAFGAAQTIVDQTGIFQRNFFFLPKKLAWDEIEKGWVASREYRSEQDGQVEYRTRIYAGFKGGRTTIHINANSAGAENWWDEMRALAREKLGGKFEG